MPCSWETFEFAFAKASCSAAELLKGEISKEQAIKQRLITSYDPRTTSAITDQEIAELSKLADTGSPFLRQWYALRLQWEVEGCRIMTNAEQRRAIKTAEYNPTYVAPTSYRVLTTLRGRPMEQHIKGHPYLDRLLTEEELHIASCVDSGDFLIDVLTYITHMGIRPFDLDREAQLEYNPNFYTWLLQK